MHNPKLRLFSAAATAFLLVNVVDVAHVTVSVDPLGSTFSLGSEAIARSSGGRSRGGSFGSRSRSSSPSRSNNRSNDSPSSGGYDRQNDNRPSYGGGPVIIPVPGGGGYHDPYRSNSQSIPNSSNPNTTNQANTNDGSWIVGLIFLAILGGVAALVIFFIIKAARGSSSSGANELENDTVTVSKLQVALLAQAREIQQELSELTEAYDPETPEGLLQQLQESALALLRMPENWTHVSASSQKVKGFDEAQRVFEQLSIVERSKFSVESLSRVGGKVSKRAIKLDPDEDPASYIVVTLLIGTAYDNPLFAEVRTEAALQEVLQKIAAIPPDYLMVFELLWSPQDPSDSLTYDELLTEYSDMAQI